MIKPIQLQHPSFRLQSLWHAMWRQIQKYIEHSPMTNGETVASLELGHVVYCSGDREVLRAVDTSTTTAAAIGVVDDSTTAPGVQCVVATEGLRLVRMKDELGDISKGTGAALYVSDVPGQATTTTAGLTATLIIGAIADAEIYQGDPALPGYYPYVKALINIGCCVAGR